ncbi:MAG: HEAT repeat domain-containing protein [Verrucomicrobiaceae bacterium]|nr:MAG: HEAT repeat domain-containing protein [Verrucomicrobiaceae bacterium]
MKAKALCAVLVPVVVVSGYCLWPRAVTLDLPEAASAVVTSSSSPVLNAELNSVPNSGLEPATTSTVSESPAIPAEAVDLAVALEQKMIVSDMVGNGRESLKIMVMNKRNVPLRVTVPVGQVFSCGRNAVITVRPSELEVGTGKTAEFSVQIAALRSSNTVEIAPYQVSYQTVPKLELFLTYVQDRVELSASAIQTAVLALTDNLPLGAVAKFTMAGGALPSRFNTDAFRAETQDIIAALGILRELGVRDHAIAMTIDPQLRIEAMIDPLTRAAAMRYYRIAPELEWEFWRAELMNGEPCTRHYALYGIARFYPEVALEMLPRWVRETRTNPVYRLSAAQALADTQKPEALPILRQLADELGEGTELGKAAGAAAEYLDYRLAQLAAAKTAVAFRTDKDEVQF